MSDPELKPCWYRVKGKWKPGLFHQWGTEPGGAEGDGNHSVGLIEDHITHAMVTPPPEDVHFGSTPDY